MKKFVSTLCAAVLALTPMTATTAQAGPAGFSLHQGAASPLAVGENLVQVRSGNRHYQNRRGFDRRNFDRRGHNRGRFDNRHRRAQPHRPSRQQSRGPDLGSAVVGAIVGGLIVHQFQQQPQPRAQAGSFLSQNHIAWCQNRWRSYRITDNSYQPYNGPRRVCVSPYGPS